MNGNPRRATGLRAAAAVTITAVITLAAACSDQDTVDTVPPPWPTRTVSVPEKPEPATPTRTGRSTPKTTPGTTATGSRTSTTAP